jgi:hypothetical protein
MKFISGGIMIIAVTSFRILLPECEFTSDMCKYAGRKLIDWFS